MPGSNTAGTPDSAITSTFGEELGLVFENMTGEKPLVSSGAPAPLPRLAERLTWRQQFNLDTLAPAWIVAERQAAGEAGARMLKAAGIDDGDLATAVSTYVEILSQAFSGLTRNLSIRAKCEVSCTNGGETDEAPPAAQLFVPLELRFPDGFKLTAYSHFAERTVEQQEQAVERVAAAEAARNTPSFVENSKTLDLLLDVELPVSVSFGRAQMPLKDLVKLTTGSIIELNRTLAEPVELIVNNCVIAKGEVVVVEGNFGVRIQHVVSRQDRLRTIL